MYALDFEYDGQCLSDYGFVICNFGDQSDMDIVSSGSTIVFNKVPKRHGKKHSRTHTYYDECIQSTFQICKNPDTHNNLIITNDEYRDLVRWLNRHEFLPMQFLDEDILEDETCIYKASFNIEKININKNLYGLELTMETDAPFGYALDKKITLNITDTSKKYSVIDMSDEIGFVYPSLTITCNSSGNLSIKNITEGCEMRIDGCSKGEVITVDGESLIISTTLNSHKIYNDFYFEFLRIGNTFDNRLNQITASLPCTLEIKYSPIIKGSPD